MMAKAGKDIQEAQVEAVQAPQSSPVGEGVGTNWYKNGGIGLVGGVIGAVAIMILTPLFQKNTVTAQIERQAERIDEAKAEREKEFSRVFNALAELNEKSRTHETTIGTLDKQVNQITRMQGNQATKLQDFSQAIAGLSADVDELKDVLDRVMQFQPSEVSSEQTDWGADVTTLKARIMALEAKLETLPQLMRQWEEERQRAYLWRPILRKRGDASLVNLSGKVEKWMI